MPSYSQYKRQMAVMDADDANIETWITVKGNHIPIMKGQSKEEAVQSFLEKKGKSSSGAKKEPAQKSGKSIGAKPAKTPKTAGQLKKAASKLESDPAYHYERADRLSEMIKQREKELENPNISRAMKNTIERGIGELQLAISKHWDAAGKLEKAAREKAKPASFNTTTKVPSAIREEFMKSQKKKYDTVTGTENGTLLSLYYEKGSKPSNHVGTYNHQTGEYFHNTPSAEKPSKKEKTIGEMEEAGENVSHLKQAMQHVHYGFYEEKGKNMTPTQFKEFLKSEQEKNVGKNDYYANRTKQRYPEAEKLAASEKPANKGWQNARSSHPETIGKVVRRVVKKIGEARNKNND